MGVGGRVQCNAMLYSISSLATGRRGSKIGLWVVNMALGEMRSLWLHTCRMSRLRAAAAAAAAVVLVVAVVRGPLRLLCRLADLED